MIEYLDRANKDVKKITEKALNESFNIVTPGIEAAMTSHRRTGKTERSIAKKRNVKWTGTLASIDVGFSIRKGGLASIFLMYGTPKMQPDKKLYNAIYGNATKRKVRTVQEKVFAEEIRKVTR